MNGEEVAARRRLNVAVVGVSGSRTCGVRDHAGLLAAGLAAQGVDCSWHWLNRQAETPRGAHEEFLAWADALPGELEREGAEAVLLHYSVFSYSYRGFPLFVAPALRALRRSGLPLVAILHEYVYPWGRGGLRGKAWAATQSVALRRLMQASTAAVVTAPFRAEWLERQRWLPRRPVALAPVFSNLPSPSPPAGGELHEPPLVGLFGYGYEGAAVTLALDALAELRRREPAPRLALLGAPGADSPAAREWLAGARARGFAGAISFSGVLPAQQLADELAACDVLLHLEPSGPTSRKGSLAGSLASGTAVVALDGPRRWEELLQADAALIVEPSSRGLAEGVARLLDDEALRARIGAAGAAFAGSAMGVPRSSLAVTGLLEELLGAPAAGAQVPGAA